MEKNKKNAFLRILHLIYRNTILNVLSGPKEQYTRGMSTSATTILLKVSNDKSMSCGAVLLRELTLV